MSFLESEQEYLQRVVAIQSYYQFCKSHELAKRLEHAIYIGKELTCENILCDSEMEASEGREEDE
jgi:hypothetical protein